MGQTRVSRSLQFASRLENSTLPARRGAQSSKTCASWSVLSRPAHFRPSVPNRFCVGAVVASKRRRVAGHARLVLPVVAEWFTPERRACAGLLYRQRVTMSLLSFLCHV